jgi:hypothetical protein
LHRIRSFDAGGSGHLDSGAGRPLVDSARCFHHFGEMAVRIAAGAVFIIAAPVTRIPAAYAFFGWFLVGSALVLVLLPRRWHASYSTWWADRISPPAVRIIAPISVIAGGLLIWTLLYR